MESGLVQICSPSWLAGYEWVCMDPEGCPGVRQRGACLTELLGWFCWRHVLPGSPLHTPVTHLSQSSGQSPLLPRNRLGKTWLEGPLSCWELFPPHSTTIMSFYLRISKDMFSPFLVTWGTGVSRSGRRAPSYTPAEGPPGAQFLVLALPNTWPPSLVRSIFCSPGLQPWAGTMSAGDCQGPSSSPHPSGLVRVEEAVLAARE